MEELISFYQRTRVVVNLVSIAVTVLTIVSMWMVFAKAGQRGWKIFIPFYNTYIRFKIAHSVGKYWAVFVMTFAALITGGYAGFRFLSILLSNGRPYKYISPEMLLLLAGVTVILLLICAVIRLIVNFSMAKAFGLPGIFGLGLWLLPVIFYSIIAFNGNIQYTIRRKYAFLKD